MKLLSKSWEDYTLFGLSPYQELFIILENNIIEGNASAKYQYQTFLEFHCGCIHRVSDYTLSNFLVWFCARIFILKHIIFL